MADWSRMRKVWTEERNKHGIKDGAVPGVGVGNAIEKVQKALGKGYESTAVEAASLVATLKRYQDKIKPKAPRFADWIEKNIAADAKTLLADARADTEFLDWVVKDCLPNSAPDAASLFPDVQLAARAEQFRRDNPGSSWADAARQLNLYALTIATAPDVQRRGTTIMKTTWRLQLPGKDVDYANVREYGVIMLKDLKLALSWMQVTSFDEFGNKLGELRTVKTGKDSTPWAKNSVKSLLS